MNILGISCYYHDAAAAILQKGQLIAAAEEERFSRIKHDAGFPVHAIRFCLEQAQISGRDLDYAVFYEKPFLKFERILLASLKTFPRSYRVFREAMKRWLPEKLWIKNTIKEQLDIDDKKIFFSEHHVSHASSAFLCSPFQEAAILTADGAGEWTTTATGSGSAQTVTLHKEIAFPHSLGLLYSAFTAFLGFKVNDGEYKVMGLAPYGKPRYVDKIYKLITVEDDGGFHINTEFFSYHYSLTDMFNSKFNALFGAPRDPSAAEDVDPYFADLAASIQKVTEDVLLKIARRLYKETGLKNLCIAGGVGLNSVANWRLYNETPFENIFVQPAAGDSGGALGACLYFYHCVLGHPRSFVMEHAYWGKEYDDEAILKALKASRCVYEHIDNDAALIDRAVTDLTSGKIVGWYQGRFEWGPRALGNRSIIADPRRAEMKDTINRKIKFRESFRPFAPSVLYERVEEFFPLKNSGEQNPAAFMLMVPPVREAKRGAIPAVTHTDGTGRLQSVQRTTNPRYYALIKKFETATGVPVLLNTSFNLKGEPIVATPGEAICAFERSDMDVLFLNNYLAQKETA